MAEFYVEFEAISDNIQAEFESITEVSDGGYERGYSEGFVNGEAQGRADGLAEGEEIGYGKGYEQGNTDGYTTGKTEGESIGFADALAKRTELLVEEAGEYVPTGESTGFKKVIVGIQKGENLDEVVAEQAELIEELSATLDEKIGAYDVGYDAALEKLTDLVVTENGEYTPSEDSTGFKSVSVAVVSANKLPQVMDRTVVELTASDLQGATKVFTNFLRQCEQLKSVVIPSTVKTIEQTAFAYCKALETVEIQHGVEQIDYAAFEYCSNLLSIEIPDSVKGQLYYTFNNCEKMKIATVGTGVTSITSTFRACRAMETLIVKATTPPTLSSDALWACNALTKIAVPVGCGDTYKAATNWSAKADIIVEEEM